MDKKDLEDLLSYVDSVKAAVDCVNRNLELMSNVLKVYQPVPDHDTSIPLNSPGAAVGTINTLMKSGETHKAQHMRERLVNFLISEVENSKRYQGLHESVLSPEVAIEQGYKWMEKAGVTFGSELYRKYDAHIRDGEIKPEPSPEPPTGESDFFPEYKSQVEMTREHVVNYYIDAVKKAQEGKVIREIDQEVHPELMVEEADFTFKKAGISYYSELYNKFLASLPPNLKNKAISLIPEVTKKHEGPKVVESKIAGIISSLPENKYTFVTDGCTYLGVAGIAYASKEYNNFRNFCNEEQRKLLDELMADEAVRDYFFKAKKEETEYDVLTHDEQATSQAAPV